MKHPQFELHADIEERHWWFLGRRRIMRELIHHVVPPSRDSIIVDVGCGTGGNIAALADEYSCLGIDTSRDAISFARRRFPEVRFLCGSVPADLGSAREAASMFLLMDVLEHVRDDAALLAELLVAASPGSYLLLTVPADPSLWSEHDVSFGHYRRYHLQHLESLWAGLPVSVHLVSYYNARLHPVVRVMRAFNRWRGHASGMAGTDFSMPVGPVNALLEGILGGEKRALLAALQGKGGIPFSRGVSLIALLRRERE